MYVRVECWYVLLFDCCMCVRQSFIIPIFGPSKDVVLGVIIGRSHIVSGCLKPYLTVCSDSIYSAVFSSLCDLVKANLITH